MILWRAVRRCMPEDDGWIEGNSFVSVFAWTAVLCALAAVVSMAARAAASRARARRGTRQQRAGDAPPSPGARSGDGTPKEGDRSPSRAQGDAPERSPRGSAGDAEDDDRSSPSLVPGLSWSRGEVGARFGRDHQRRCDGVATEVAALAKAQYQLEEKSRAVGGEGDSVSARAAAYELLHAGEGMGNDLLDRVCEALVDVVASGVEGDPDEDPRVVAAREYMQVLRAVVAQSNSFSKSAGVFAEAERHDVTGVTARAKKLAQRAEEERAAREEEVKAKQKQQAEDLLAASAASAVETVTALLDDGADVEAADEKGRRALHIASSRNSVHITRILLRNGAKPNVFDEQGLAPLHAAAAAGSRACTDALLQADAGLVDLPTRDGRTALVIAAQVGNADLTELLLRNGADGEHMWVAPSGLVMRALHLAVAGGHVATVATLLKYGASATGDGGEHETPEDRCPPTPIELARRQDNPELTELIEYELDRPAREAAEKAEKEAAARREKKEKALMAAVVSGSEADTAAALKEALDPSVCSINCTDDAGLTPLHMACFFGHVNIAKMLVNAGADITLRAENGRTALDIAKTMGLSDLRRALKRLVHARKHAAAGGDDDATASEPASADGASEGAGAAVAPAPVIVTPSLAPGEFDPSDFSGVWTVDEASESLAAILVELGINWVGRKLILSIEVVSTITMTDKQVTIADMTKFGGTDTRVSLNRPEGEFDTIKGEKGDIQMRGSLEGGTLVLTTVLDGNQGTTTDTRTMDGPDRIAQVLRLSKDGVVKATVKRWFVRDRTVPQPPTKAEQIAVEAAVPEVEPEADTEGGSEEAKGDDGVETGAGMVTVKLPSGHEISCSPEEAAKIESATAATVVGGDEAALAKLKDLKTRHSVPGTANRVQFTAAGDLHVDSKNITQLLGAPKARVVDGESAFECAPVGAIVKRRCHVLFVSAKDGHVSLLEEKTAGDDTSWRVVDLSHTVASGRTWLRGRLVVLTESSRLHVYFISQAQHVEELLFWNKWSLVSPFEIIKGPMRPPPPAQLLDTFCTTTTLGFSFRGEDDKAYELRYSIFKGWRCSALST